MENVNDNKNPNLQKQASERLFEKSAELKKKNADLMEKLEALKKQTEQLLHNTSTISKS
jgi:hypothetical protein